MSHKARKNFVYEQMIYDGCILSLAEAENISPLPLTYEDSIIIEKLRYPFRFLQDAKDAKIMKQFEELQNGI